MRMCCCELMMTISIHSIVGVYVDQDVISQPNLFLLLLLITFANAKIDFHASPVCSPTCRFPGFLMLPIN